MGIIDSGFTIRNAVLEDLAAIVDIYNSTIPGRMVTADTEPVTVDSRLHWFDEHSPSDRPLWVAVHRKDERIAGWLSFQSFYGRPAYRATAELSIYIHEQFRSRGLGRALLQQAMDACGGLGIKTLLGFIFAHNEPSLNLFKQFQFEEWAYMPRIAELEGIERDLVIVGKRVIA